MKKFLIAIAAVIPLLLVPTGASADLCGKIARVRTAVRAQHGQHAAARDICQRGVTAGAGWFKATEAHAHWHPATRPQKAKYLRQLQRLVTPKPYMGKRPAGPRVRPAGVRLPELFPVGTAACIVSRESTYNPQAVNGQYHGIAQWSPEAWSRMGGHRYATDPLGATYQQQLRVLSHGLAVFGCRDFCPFDGC